MKLLVTGAAGQLGQDVIKVLKERGHKVFGVDIEDMDITNYSAVENVFTRIKPEGVIHCAAYTQVDLAEDNPELCKRINVEGTKNISIFCKKFDSKLIYISTDYVFSGEGEEPFRPEQETAPLNIYGLTKFQGEEMVKLYVETYFIVRISWVFGKHGKNFVKTMLQLGKEKKEVNAVEDQIGSPTYTADLANLLSDMIETEKYGVYHASNEGFCSWYEFAREIFKQKNLDVKVNPVKSSEFPAKAKRPHNSRLNKEKLTMNGFQTLPRWQSALSEFLNELEKDFL